MGIKSVFRRIALCVQDTRGTTAIEFAVIAPLFFLILFATLEFGLIGFTQIVLQAAVADVSRTVSISTNQSPGFDRVNQFKTLVRQKISALPNGANVSISSAKVTGNGGGGIASVPDICLTTPPSSPASCPAGTPFQDNNGNGSYDAPGGNDLGSSGDVVQLKVSLPWQVKFPFVKSLFSGKDSNGNATGIILLSASTIMKNE